MVRRDLLKSLLGLAGVLGFARPAPATAFARKVLLQVSPVAGIQYHEWEDVWHMLREGDSLALVRETENA